MMVLHADSAKNRPNRTRSTALLADHLAHVGRGNAKAEYGAFVSLNSFHKNLLGNIH